MLRFFFVTPGSLLGKFRPSEIIGGGGGGGGGHPAPPTSLILKIFQFNILRGVLFSVRAGNDIIKADFMHTKRTNCLTKMRIGIHFEELK